MQCLSSASSATSCNMFLEMNWFESVAEGGAEPNVTPLHLTVGDRVSLLHYGLYHDQAITRHDGRPCPTSRLRPRPHRNHGSR